MPLVLTTDTNPGSASWADSTTITSVTATVVNSSPVAVSNLETMQVILIDVVPCVVNLSAIESGKGLIVVKDRTGSASVGQPITINPSGAETIDGQPNLVINGPYASAQLYGNGTDWSIL